MPSGLHINLYLVFEFFRAALARLDLDKNFTFDQMSKLLSDNIHQIFNSALFSVQFIAYVHAVL